jgi:hypothetical protein
MVGVDRRRNDEQGENQMSPETAVKWKEALAEYEKAKQYMPSGEHDAAENAAKQCVRLAAFAVMEFSREGSGRTPHLVIAPACEAVCFDWKKHCSRPCDYLREARRLLVTRRNSLPPEHDLPRQAKLPRRASIVSPL